MENKQIKWEKYENYVNKHIDISKSLMTGRYIKPENEVKPDIDDFMEEDEDEDEGMVVMQFPITRELMDGIKLCSNYDCWIGHCNFVITNKTFDQLDNMNGVEYLDVLSKYRFIIGLGKAFTLTDVRGELQKELGVLNENSN